MPRTRLFRSLLATLAVACAPFAASPAGAAEYVVDGCHRADGSVAPIDGWSVVNPSSGTIQNQNLCAAESTGSFKWFPYVNAIGQANGVRFSTGDSSLIPRTAGLWLAVDTSPTYEYWVNVLDGTRAWVTSEDGPAGPHAIPPSSTAVNFAAAAPLVVPRTPATSSSATIDFFASCHASDVSDCAMFYQPGSAAFMRRSAVTIDDISAPLPSSITGSLLADATHLRAVLTETVTATATVDDAGSGARSLVLLVDGTLRERAAISGAAASCTPTSTTPLPTYDVRRPCPGHGTATLEFDTNRLTNGTHELGLYAEDAAGNRTAIATGSARVANVEPAASNPTPTAVTPSGTPAPAGSKITASWASAATKSRDGRKPRASIGRSWSAKAVDTVCGQVVDGAGKPVAGITIHPALSWRAAGAPAPAVAAVVTAADGSFSIPIARAFGTVEVALASGSATAKLSRSVSASTTLLAPASARPGAAITFRGKLRAAAGTLARVPITLEVWNGGRWRAFATAQTTTKGVWKRRIRFAKTPGKYRVRARVGVSIGYPFAAGVSDRTRSVVVR